MYRLTREVRLNLPTDGRRAAGGSGHAGMPAVDGAAVQWTVAVTLAGVPAAESGYLIDIKAVDDGVRQRAFPLLADAVRDGTALPAVALRLHAELSNAWPGFTLDRIRLAAGPFQFVAAASKEAAVVRLSHHFEFSAAHRLHNAQLSAAENVSLFGKCNNADGHGHNYEVRVTLAGRPATDGRLIPLADLERIVDEHAIRKVDHKHLNLQVDEFRALNPSVENIARVLYGWLRPHLSGEAVALESVTVWETPKTSCEYSEA